MCFGDDPRTRPAYAPARTPNDDSLLAEFPWLSICGRERNYIKASRTPIVFRELDDNQELTYAGSLAVPFQPDKLALVNGELYHPSPNESTELSLVQTNLASQLFECFSEDGLHFRWKGETFPVEHR